MVFFILRIIAISSTHGPIFMSSKLTGQAYWTNLNSRIVFDTWMKCNPWTPLNALFHFLRRCSLPLILVQVNLGPSNYFFKTVHVFFDAF